MSEWKQIETAPKDGRRVLVSTLNGVGIAYWVNGCDDGIDSMGHDSGWFGEGDCDPIVFGRTFGNPDYQHPAENQPLYWMELPEWLCPYDDDGNFLPQPPRIFNRKER